MKKIGIISSFDILCGNATYSKSLIEGIKKKYDAMEIAIPPSIQKRKNPKAIREVIDKARSCDAINIQLELTLFGPTPNSAVSFIEKLIKSNKNKSITMHRVEQPPQNIIRSIISKLQERWYHKHIKNNNYCLCQ